MSINFVENYTIISIIKTKEGRGLLVVGERVANLQRLFNFRESFTKEDDIFPVRIRAVPVMGKYQSEPDCTIRDCAGSWFVFNARQGEHVVYM